MRCRPPITVALTLLLLFVAPPVTVWAQPSCTPQAPPVPVPATTSLFMDDSLLGPTPLPGGAVATLVNGYQRFGPSIPETPAGAAHWRSTYFSQNGDSPLNWPPNPPYTDGFDVTPDTQTPDETRSTLTAATRIDRFGNPTGGFLAPAGTPFSQRALPPQNLDSPGGTPVSNYHVYCVMKAFDVDAGPIAPWFGQPGRGTQYVLRANYAPFTPSGNYLTVQDLLANGYLEEIAPGS